MLSFKVVFTLNDMKKESKKKIKPMKITKKKKKKIMKSSK